MTRIQFGILAWQHFSAVVIKRRLDTGTHLLQQRPVERWRRVIVRGRRRAVHRTFAEQYPVGVVPAPREFGYEIGVDRCLALLVAGSCFCAPPSPRRMRAVTDPAESETTGYR